MSKEFNVDYTDCELEILTPDQAAREMDIEGGNYALVFGDPWHSAYTIQGTLDGLRDFALRVSTLVKQTSQAELPQPANPMRHVDISDLRGCMVDGYTSEDVNRAFGRLGEAFGVRLVCVWDYYDDCGFGGNSQFYVETEDDRLHDLVGDLWQWVNGRPEEPSTPISPGAPASWRGGPADVPHCATDDGLCNYAVEDKDRNPLD